jgi:molybdopterin molybdotransferase
MISFEQALQAVRSQVPSLAQEHVACSSAVGRVLSQDLTAPTCLPAFDNAAMDGFALSAAHLALLPGTRVPVSKLQVAGDALFELGTEACQIMTGALLPAGAVAVVPMEQVDVYGDLHAPEGMQIGLHEVPELGQNIRKAGEDVQAGQTMFVAGTVLQARHLMLLAALGIETVCVFAPVKVAVVCTGSELHQAGTPLRVGQIYNSNGAYIQSAIQSMAAQLVFRRDIADDTQAYMRALHEAELAGCQIVISTGAVSMGVHDFVPKALASANAEIVFHKLRMRPGKPTLFARLPSGVLVFGLPGNPMSCAVGLRFLVNAAMRAMQQRAPERPMMARLAAVLQKKPDWCLIHKAVLTIDAAGHAQLSVLPGQESFRIAPFVEANAWVVLPENASVLEAGTLLPCFANEFGPWPGVV